MQKQRPFTRKQRARMRKRQRIELAAERRAAREEAKAYAQTLGIYKGCDPARTTALADGQEAS